MPYSALRTQSLKKGKTFLVAFFKIAEWYILFLDLAWPLYKLFEGFPIMLTLSPLFMAVKNTAAVRELIKICILAWALW